MADKKPKLDAAWHILVKKTFRTHIKSCQTERHGGRGKTFKTREAKSN